MQRKRVNPIGVSRWPIWSLPPLVLTLIVVVELVALGLLIAGFRGGIAPGQEGWPVLLAVLVSAGIISTEASLGVERARRQSEDAPHIDLSAVWSFAAAALLPGSLACIVVVISYGYLYLRVWRSLGVAAHRVLFSAAAVMLAVQAAAAVIARWGDPDPFHTVPGLLALLAGVLVFALVNMSLIVAAIVLSGPSPSLAALRQVLGHGDDAVLEIATLSMGALAAGAVGAFGAGYVVLVLPPLIILHRTVLVRQLEEAATTDSKTGLLNATAWDIEADRAVRRIARLAGNATVLVLDLDNFKQVNDEHGHLVGDQVLARVAAAIREVVRDDDLVGRFGGEEFVVLLPSPDGDPAWAGAEAAANRIRSRIEELTIEVTSSLGHVTIEDLSISIGGATSPHDGATLTDLLRVADAAMYAAKKAGRNRVFMGGERPHGRPGIGPAPAPVDLDEWVDADRPIVGRSRPGNDQ